MSALWGKLAAAILMQKWDDALEDLNRLKEIIDSKVQFLLGFFRPRFILGIKPVIIKSVVVLHLEGL